MVGQELPASELSMVGQGLPVSGIGMVGQWLLVCVHSAILYNTPFPFGCLKQIEMYSLTTGSLSYQ